MARPEKYPYDDWFTGRMRKITRGKDYDCASDTMRRNLKKASKVRGMKVKVLEVDEDYIIFQGRQS